MREMIPLWLGVGGEICGLYGPSVQAPVRIKSSSFSSSDRCFVISLTQCIFLGGDLALFRLFRACFVVLTWLGRRLAPRRFGPGDWSVILCESFVSQCE